MFTPNPHTSPEDDHFTSPSPCRVCGGKDTRFHLSTWQLETYTEMRVTYVRCPTCGCVLDAGPFTSVQDAHQEFPYRYIESGAGVYYFCSLVQLLREKKGASGTVRLLDLGGAFGINAHMAKLLLGWEVVSADVSRLSALGGAALGIPAHTGLVTETTFGDTRFDVIFCTDVLEHVADPAALLSTIRALLAPGGILALGTPNADVLESSRLEEEWGDIYYVGHYTLFSTRALDATLDAAGLAPHKRFLHWGSSGKKHIAILAGPQQELRGLGKFPSMRDIVPLFLEYCAKALDEAPRSLWHERYQNSLRFRRIETLVHAGRYAEALPLIRDFDAWLAAQGVRLADDAPTPWKELNNYKAALPSFLGRYFLVRGLFAMNHEQNQDRARRYFAASAEINLLLRRAGTYNLEDNIGQALYHEALACRMLKRAEEAVTVLERMAAMYFLPERLRKSGRADLAALKAELEAASRSAEKESPLAARAAVTVQSRPEPPHAHFFDCLWCDVNGVYVRGWAHAFEHKVLGMHLESGGERRPVTERIRRPDLLAFYPDYPQVEEAGFACFLPCRPFQPVFLCLETAAGPVRIPLEVPEHVKASAAPQPDLGGWDMFVPGMKDIGGTVLQIGGRLNQGEQSYSLLFSPQCSYLCGDIHPGKHVDVVLDAHALSRHFAPASLAGVFSEAVLEHLAAPWLAAAEINRVLRLGGLTYHRVPTTVPVHELPNDFWRMTEQGLRLLFGKPLGFEVLYAGTDSFCRVFPETYSGHACCINEPSLVTPYMAYVIAKKIADIPEDAVRWPFSVKELEAIHKAYPLQSGGEEV